MFATVFAQLTGKLESSFVLNALFPALAFSVGALLVGMAGAGGVSAGVSTWERQAGTVQAGIVILAVTGLYLLALVLSGLTLAIVRAFEGYLGPARWFGQSSRSWHDARRMELIATRYAQASIDYPLPDAKEPFDLMPTRLGNIMLSGERYAYERYGADAVVVWPRLFPLLPASAITSLAAPRAQMEQLLVLSVLSGTFGLVGGPYLAASKLALGWALACLVGCLLVACALYRAALGFAVSYASQVRTAFDLHRLDVFGALRVPMPSNRAEERRRWGVINRTLYRNDPADWPYTPVAVPALGPAPASPAARPESAPP